jgi:hypothetical protein
MKLVTLAIALLFLSVASAEEIDLTPLDAYLGIWDRFAQGDNLLVQQLNSTWPQARETLISALRAKDPRAPSRLVFLMLVQVGGSIPVDSETGRAWRDFVGEFSTVKGKDGKEVYFAADFYHWWTRHRSAQDDLPLLVAWLSRDFARNTVIPMYERMSKTK